MPDINLFNGTALEIGVQVRFGASVLVSGTSLSVGWSPGTPEDTEPGWGGTNPQAGQFGYGDNPVLINNGQNTVTMNIHIPNRVQPTDSLQIYFYYRAPSKESPNATAYWVGLVNGFPFGGSIQPQL